MDWLKIVVHFLVKDGKNLPVEPFLGLDYLFTMVKLLCQVQLTELLQDNLYIDFCCSVLVIC